MKSKIENKAVVLTAETDAQETVLLHLWLSRPCLADTNGQGQIQD